MEYNSCITNNRNVAFVRLKKKKNCRYVYQCYLFRIWLNMMDILVLRNLVYVKKYWITDYYTFLTHVYGTHTHTNTLSCLTRKMSLDLKVKLNQWDLFVIDFLIFWFSKAIFVMELWNFKWRHDNFINSNYVAINHP